MPNDQTCITYVGDTVFKIMALGVLLNYNYMIYYDMKKRPQQ